MHIARGTINQSSVLEPIDRQVGLSNQNLGALVPLLLVSLLPTSLFGFCRRGTRDSSRGCSQGKRGASSATGSGW